MKRYIYLLLSAFIASGCSQTTKPASQKIPQTATEASERGKLQSSVRFSAFSPDNKYFVVGLWHGDYHAGAEKITGSLQIWDVRKRQKTGTLRFDNSVVTAVFLPCSNSVLVSAGKIYVCELGSGRITKQLNPTVPARAMALSPDEKSLALVTEENVEIRNLNSWQIEHRIEMKAPRAAFIRTMAFSPDGRHLVSGAWDVPDGIQVHSPSTGRQMWSLDCDQQGNVAWSSDGRRIAASVTTAIFLLRSNDGRLIKKIPSDYGSRVFFSANGKRMFFTHRSTLITCDASSGEIVNKKVLTNLSSSVLSSDAQQFARVAADGSQIEFGIVDKKQNFHRGSAS